MSTDDYVVGHVGDALTRLGETDVHAVVDGGRLVLTGNVVTEERRALVCGTAAEVAEGLEVVDRLTVLDHPGPTAVEELA